MKERFKSFKIILVICTVMTLYFLVKGLVVLPDSEKVLFKGIQLALGLFLMIIPIVIERKMKVSLPRMLVIFYCIFIIGSVFLGTGFGFYGKIAYWDKLLHFISAGLLVLFGVSFYLSLLNKAVISTVEMKLCYFFGTFFAISGGVFWEFYEFIFDGLLDLNMQRFASKGVDLIGREALMDTMGDLFIDVLGAIAMLVYLLITTQKNKSLLNELRIRRIK
ncbi:hypothetical protein G7081_04220 [Vagococcus coleopterorum]|uniref:Membrane-spanning protein n=1 Tax=Vagococcus coleopterorum TaxID=2714946 RepID=A0A6G8AMV3_9ENTE|nr:hypothetical protein [Vagococcus coleopterorum]QIL46326.1 hypothetical protein G7081_04220 [Vagococcus coleopterorum]